MSRTPVQRAIVPVALLAASALLLTGCGSANKDAKSKTSSSPSPSASTSPATDANGCGTYTSGDTSKSVKVTGDFGKTQTATFKTPLKASGMERTVLTEGTGAKTAAGQTIDSLVSVYLGKDGKALGSQPVSLTVGDSSVIE